MCVVVVVVRKFNWEHQLCVIGMLALCYSHDCCIAILAPCQPRLGRVFAVLGHAVKTRYRVPLVKHKKKRKHSGVAKTPEAQFIVSGTLKNHQKHGRKKKKTDSNRRRNLSAPIWLNGSRSAFAPNHVFSACFGSKAALCLIRHPRCSKLSALRGAGPRLYHSPLNSRIGGASERRQSAHFFEFLLHFLARRSLLLSAVMTAVSV